MRLCSIFLCSILFAGQPARAESPDAEGIAFFEKQIRPVLVDRCQRCHGEEKQRGGLRLDSRSWALKGGDAGSALVPGDPDKSLLLQAIRHTNDLKMPPKSKLDASIIGALTQWIARGAPWPTESGITGPLSIDEVRRTHWAFKPVQSPTLPEVKYSAWVQTPIDAFVLAKLEREGLSPSPRASATTLVRRMTFDMWGLPPTPEEVLSFERAFAIDSKRALGELVERLLRSPRYGERWGRHWLDVARYADTKGYVFQEERRYPFAYTYRDYVIRAFNEDVPFDRFVVEQLAADRLELGEDKRALAGLGFLTLGRRFLNNSHDIIDDRIDVTMRGLQGLTVSCARCHDHKFDPIPTQDYYSLYGVFASSTEPRDLPIIEQPAPSDESRRFEAELNKRQRAVDEFRKRHAKELAARNRKFRDELRKLERKVEQWKVESPDSPPRAMVLHDERRPHDERIFKRGNPNNRGEIVPRRFPEIVAGTSRPSFTSGSGRLEMARTIASKDNPLTARVLVNRVWGWHFGAGLVTTPSDFGLRSDAPSHPQLLDWLAGDFMEQGWSLKALHRRILLSATYLQSSDPTSASERDPDNRLLSRFNRRRLEFEPLRDSLLYVAGRLDETRGGRPVDLLRQPFSRRRTVYGFIDRQNLPGVFRTFDLASPDATAPQRYNTTVPQQSLFLMNSPFVVEQAKAFAARKDVASLKTPEEQITRMYWLAFGRAPRPDELGLGKEFLATAKREGTLRGVFLGKALMPIEKYAQVLMLSNEFSFVD